MTEDRIALLDQLDFSWEVRPSLERPRATWQQRLDELKEFHKEHQHFRVPTDSYPQLHAWCQEQKQRLKMIDKNGKDASKRMGLDRIRALSDVGVTKDVELGDQGLVDNMDTPADMQDQSVTDQDEGSVSGTGSPAQQHTENLAVEENKSQIEKSQSRAENRETPPTDCIEKDKHEHPECTLKQHPAVEHENEINKEDSLVPIQRVNIEETAV